MRGRGIHLGVGRIYDEHRLWHFKSSEPSQSER